MCPNCMMSLTMVLGGTGSAIIAAAVGLRFASIRPGTRVAPTNTEETAS